jgi:hypothetical protein
MRAGITLASVSQAFQGFRSLNVLEIIFPVFNPAASQAVQEALPGVINVLCLN